MTSLRPRRGAIGSTRPREVLDTFLGLKNRRAAACQCRWHATNEVLVRECLVRWHATNKEPGILLEKSRDKWTNVTPNILSFVGRKLHLQENHPLSSTRKIIESCFPDAQYTTYNMFPPIVRTFDNFDSLGFPKDHPGRSKSDTYYINKDYVLRTHTSAHQVSIFRCKASVGYLISGDVYRRDAIDRSHYPVFHQMEGARTWSRLSVPKGDIVAAVKESLRSIPKTAMKVEDPFPDSHSEQNARQPEHSEEEVQIIASHLKRTLERVVSNILSRARAAAKLADPDLKEEPLQVRWVESVFPFTSPSWELEVFWQGEWLEVLGCGIVKHQILKDAGVEDQIGWAFGIGLERIAMLLYGIPDIRLFWSTDPRFLNQFHKIDIDAPFDESGLRRFVPFSIYPSSTRDMSFWLPDIENADQGNQITTNDVLAIVREVGGDMVESVTLFDTFTKKNHEGRDMTSVAYRLVYRSLERTLTRQEVSVCQERIARALLKKLGVIMK